MPLELHISLANLHNNLRFFRRITKNSAELSAVVKSNAYGLGITKIVPEMERFGVRSFFTATISEGTMAKLNTLRDETGNAYTITITDTTADAGELHTLNGRTDVAVNAAALTSLSGTLTEVGNVYAAAALQTPTDIYKVQKNKREVLILKLIVM